MGRILMGSMGTLMGMLMWILMGPSTGMLRARTLLETIDEYVDEDIDEANVGTWACQRRALGEGKGPTVFVNIAVQICAG
jgi:hypothetical protein